MKPIRIILLILLALLLTGCGEQPMPEQSKATEETTIPAPTGFYDPGSAVEQQTDGAVRVYPLQGASYSDLSFMGEKLLLSSESGELTVLHTEEGIPLATAVTGEKIPSFDVGFSTANTGVAYYSEQSNAVVLLNPILQQTDQITLPETLQQTPVISLAKKQVYYCVENEIWALDMSTGIARLVKQQSNRNQKLLGGYFDDKLLACEVTDSDGQVQTHYISAETGQTLSRDSGVFYLDTYADSYVLRRWDTTVLQTITGTLDGEYQSLRIPEAYGSLYSTLAMNGVVTSLETGNGLQLSFFDLGSGEKTAEVILPEVAAPVAIAAGQQCIWILAADGDSGEQILYRWDKTLSPVSEAGSYLGPLYTAQSPDTDALALCQEHVDWYNSQYGVRISMWENALKATGGYTVTGEYQPEVITQMLEQLESVLAQFPADFLRNTVENGWIRVSLVRRIESGEAWVSFWENGDCHILLTPQADIPAAFLTGLGYGVDSHVLGNSRDFDTWAQLNPADFAYGEACDPKYLAGESRYFVDALSTVSILEDRCRLFAAAMLPDNGEIFTADGMQKKLLRLCEGIREAYGLEKSAEEYPWEQYLQSPLYKTDTK